VITHLSLELTQQLSLELTQQQGSDRIVALPPVLLARTTKPLRAPTPAHATHLLDAVGIRLSRDAKVASVVKAASRRPWKGTTIDDCNTN
jgi:hypothetical protein